MLTLFTCRRPNIQGMCGVQDLKVSVTLNWLKEGEREENIYPCGVLGNKILGLLDKAGHKTGYCHQGLAVALRWRVKA